MDILLSTTLGELYTEFLIGYKGDTEDIKCCMML